MKIGLITFHSAHNYGAVIQAYALQKYILSTGNECIIIDFRSAAQKDFNSLYPRRNGIKSIIKNILLFPYDRKRRQRDRNFEEFIYQKMKLTKENYCLEWELEKLNNDFDVFVSGSDQIWNTTKKADLSSAYFLKFADTNKKKIGYAISLGNATKSDLIDFSELIMRYSAISCRETGAAYIISELTDREIPVVLDPTLLCDSKIFEELITGININYENYIFYYSLDGFDKRKNNLDELRILAKKLNKQIVIATPEWPQKRKGMINIINAGPKEFLALIKHADLICTNSFHGTALAIAFHKNFYVLDEYNNSDDRKISILKQLELTDRMIKGLEKVKKIENESIDYICVDEKLKLLKKYSKDFIEKAING